MYTNMHTLLSGRRRLRFGKQLPFNRLSSDEFIEQWIETDYEIPEVVSQFNTTVDDEFLVSHEYMDLFDKYCAE